MTTSPSGHATWAVLTACAGSVVANLDIRAATVPNFSTSVELLILILGFGRHRR